MQRRLPRSALLEPLFDHPVDPGADAVGIEFAPYRRRRFLVVRL